MRRTDYEPIASTYDQTRERYRIPIDAHLGDWIEEVGRPLHLLDLACGTGNYLAVQTRAFAGERIAWHGLDASAAMLGAAQRKLEGVALLRGRAEALPLESGAMHYLACNFAFHHFLDKPRALDEMARVLAPRAALALTNVAPEHMRAWWVYLAFPEAWFEDQKRFWPIERVVAEVERRGFGVRTSVEVTPETLPASELLEVAARRDLSSLAILDDTDFAAGLERLRRRADRGETVSSTSAVVRWLAARRA